MFTRQPDLASIPIHLLYEDELETWRQSQTPAAGTWIQGIRFRAERSQVALLPENNGRVAQVVAGLGKRGTGELTLWHVSGLVEKLPEGTYHLATHLSPRDTYQFALGWGYGQYRYERYRRESSPARNVRCLAPDGIDLAEVLRILAACTQARDLINTPASDLTPAALATAAVELGQRYRAETRVHDGTDLSKGFPLVHAVGRASRSAPRLVEIEWGDPRHPRVALIGKGVCFDSGGLDIKPPASMLLMKKDMGGAACALALAQLVMDSGLPVRLHVVVPAVENAVGGDAYRPGDVLLSRKGLHVEIGNTDAEGRLILADALALADASRPDLMIDLATLTGAARIALGPELPALFGTDEALIGTLTRTAAEEADPLWPMPLWQGYDDELASKIADLNNVSSSGFSGAIIGALFLKRFVTETIRWLHLDLYAWNARERPGRPIGGEAQCVRALYAFLKARYRQQGRG